MYRPSLGSLTSTVGSSKASLNLLRLLLGLPWKLHRRNGRTSTKAPFSH